MTAVLFWNDVALEVQRRDFTAGGAGDSFDPADLDPEQGGPTRTSRALAMVHIAMYDAVALGDSASRLQPYAAPGGGYTPPAPPAAAPASPADFVDGAVAGAAATVLKALWTRQAGFIAHEVARFSRERSTVDFGAGLAFGGKIGLAVLAWRENDGAQLPDDMTFDQRPMRHRPDPFSPGQGRLSTRWSEVKPFALAVPINGGPLTIHQGFLAGPPDGNGGKKARQRYDAAVKDVKDLGSAAGSTRKPDDTLAGIFWGYDGPRGLGVPPRLYNQVVRAFASQHLAGNTVEDDARLYALVNAGMADAAIIAWSAKYAYDLWRPIIGIREYQAGFGPMGGSSKGVSDPLSDPFWTPLGKPATNTPWEFNRTPDFPAYPSGHATFGAVAFRLAALFATEKNAAETSAEAMNKLTFTFVSDEFNGENQDPHGDIRPRHGRVLTLGGAILENALSRVYLGVHWRFDGIGAVAPDDLELSGSSLADPAADAKLADATEKELGGVPAGLKVAKALYTGTAFALKADGTT